MSSRLSSAPTWYDATAQKAPDRPAMAGDVTCDVAVLGGGFTGLMAALSLAERGYDVVVAEAQRIGAGASGRNGGQIVTGYNPSMAALAERAGIADAKALWGMAEEAKRLIADTVTRHGIGCGLAWGYLFAAPSRRGRTDLDAMAEQWSRDHGYAALRAVAPPELQQIVASARYLSGLYDAEGGHLHPLGYVRGIADAAAGAGVKIFEQTPIRRVDTETTALVAEGGTIRAKFLVLAAGAATGRLLPAARHKVVPIETYILATERLPRARLRAVLRDDIAVCDTNFALNYYRRTPDDRLLFGAHASYTGYESPRLRRTVRAAMLHVFPQLADVRLDYFWGGQVDITVNRLPQFGRAGSNVFFAHGFSGQGVALTGLAGKLIAEAIAGQAERFDVFARLRHPDFPPEPLRTPAVLLAAMWYRLRDLL